MNAEQKQRALDLIDVTKTYRLDAEECAVQMAALLQELVDAPTPEPFGYFKDEPFGWTDCAETDDGAIALFAAPPAPSVPDGWKHDCAGILANDVELWVDSCPHCGKPRPAAAPTPAEAPADVARDAARYRWLRNPEQEVGLVLDKRVGFREHDEGTRTGGYPMYEYRSGVELDAAIDVAMGEKGGA